MKAALVIKAAGLGSRYGGNKQVDGVGPGGEILMEYSIHDAIRAGFTKIVFIIKNDMQDLMRSLCGDRIAGLTARDGEPVEVTGYDQSALLSALSDSQVHPTRTQVGATHWPEVELSVWMTAADDPSVYRHIFFTGEDSYVEGLGERNYAFLNSEEVKAALIAALAPYVDDPANLQPAFFS